MVQHLLQLWMAPERTEPQEIDNLIILLASYVDEATPSLFCLSTNIFSAVLLSRFVAAAAAAIFGCVSTSSSVKERRERRVNIFFSDFSLSAQKEDVHWHTHTQKKDNASAYLSHLIYFALRRQRAVTQQRPLFFRRPGLVNNSTLRKLYLRTAKKGTSFPLFIYLFFRYFSVSPPSRHPCWSDVSPTPTLNDQ